MCCEADHYLALRIEWCKARARAMRWSEEVLLLRVEMCRVLRFLTWHALWWERQARRRTNLLPEAAEGVAAYAFKQASIRHRMRTSFDQLWRTTWASITHGAGASNDVLELPSSHFLPLYPEAD